MPRFAISPEIRKVGFLASGSGSTFEAVATACKDGTVPFEAAILITNNPKAGAMDRAARLGIEARRISAKSEGSEASADERICAALVGAAVDLVILVGYLKMIGPRVLDAYRGKIINTHPALLPRFGGPGMYGRHVYEAVIAAGETETGVSVHIVDEEYDHGPVLAQVPVPVKPGDTVDTLSARVQAREKSFLIETLAALAAGKLALPA